MAQISKMLVILSLVRILISSLRNDAPICFIACQLLSQRDRLGGSSVGSTDGPPVGSLIESLIYSSCPALLPI
jgi:hypothetical protein